LIRGLLIINIECTEYLSIEMSTEREYLSANLNRENKEWELGPNTPEQALKAHALFDHLVYQGDVNPLTPELEQRKRELEIRKQQIETELEEDTKGLKTHLEIQLEQIEEELNELDEYYDVYDIIPTNETFYDMDIFEISWGSEKYAVGTADEIRSSAEEYAKESINDNGLKNMFSDNFMSNYINESYFEDYVRDYYGDIIYQDPESWLSSEQRELDQTQEDEIGLNEKRIRLKRKEIEYYQSMMEKSPSTVRKSLEKKIESIESSIDRLDVENESIKSDPQGDFPDEAIENEIEDRVSEAVDYPMSTIREWDMEIENFVDVDDLVEGWIDSDGVEILSHYDGTVDEQKVNGEYYSIVRIE
jgi:chaperonin cofactor prefoldin